MTEILFAGHCPVCRTVLNTGWPNRRGNAEHGPGGSDSYNVNCVQCGIFILTRTAVPGLDKLVDRQRDALCFAIHQRRTNNDTKPIVDSALIKGIQKNIWLPSPAEQADELIRLIALKASSPSEPVSVTSHPDGASIGAFGQNGLSYLFDELVEQKLIRGRKEHFAPTNSTNWPEAGLLVRLTLSGWQRWEQLRRGAHSGKTAFLALKFGERDLDTMVEKCFRPAVFATGFTLRRLNDNPKAGLIDDRLRLAIQGARFVLADLTHGNNGAYWEAGYAEGLGKPVIYLCESSKFEKDKSHFDTNHHLTVLWSGSDPDATAARLKDTIRASVPEAAATDIVP